MTIAIPLRPARLFALLVCAVPAALPAQSPPPSVAAEFLPRWHEVMGLAPDGRSADAAGLVLRRANAELVLEQGRVYFLRPIGGRMVGAVFVGAGTLRYAPEEPTERVLLRRFARSPSLAVPVRSALLLFADSTAVQLARLAPLPGAPSDDVRDRARQGLDDLKGDHEGTFDPDVLAPLLNGDTAGFFLAHLERTDGDPLLLKVDHGNAEAVELYRRVSKRDWGTQWALVSRSAAPDRPASSARAWLFRPRLAVPRYRVDVALNEQVRGGLAMRASAALTLVPLEPVGPWLRFFLDGRLELDSAAWADGRRAEAFKAEDDGIVWVRMPGAARAGDTLALTLHYHGDMIDRYGNFFYVDPTGNWYPVNGQGWTEAVFDLTFHAPAQYPLFSVGTRTDSSRADRVVTTRWVTSAPVASATFNLGLFEARRVENPEAPPLTVVISEDAHRFLAAALVGRGFLASSAPRNMREVVGADITNALQVFTRQYGEPPHDHFTVTEIPYGEGVSFPGFISLSWGTFQDNSFDGFDQFFRAHETAHQWWGNAVRPATYRDAWLSEGLATYAGISYLQAVRRRNDDYFRYLDRYRGDILRHRDDAGLVAIGYRNSTFDVPGGYTYTVYEKGAWIFHMLRVMMLDLSTLRAERFNAMLADYYQSFRGYAVTTGDFAAIAERHVGQELGWFFDQWLNRSEVPAYRVAWRREPAEDGKFRVRLRVRQEHVSPDFRMPVLVAVDLGGDRTARFRVMVRGDQEEYLGPLLPAEPRGVTFNEYRSVLAEVENEAW